MALQKIDAYINIATAALVGATNTARGITKPTLFAGNEALFTIHALASDGSPFPIPENAEFYASVDNVLGSDHPDIITAANDKFNIEEDWDNISLDQGRFCFRLTTNTQAVIDLLEDSPKEDVFLEIWFREPGAEWAIMLHETIIIKNTTVTFVPESSEGITYATINDVDSAIFQADEGYTVEPAAVPTKTFDPNTASQADLLDFVATLAITLKTRGIL